MAASGESRRIIRFGVFELNLAAGELRKNGLKLRLQDHPFRALALLLERPGEVVSRDELREKLWPADTFVEFDHGLNTAINKIRAALGDSADTPRFIETLPRRGYRFIFPVASDPVMAASPPPVDERSPVIRPDFAGPARGLWYAATGAQSRHKKVLWGGVGVLALLALALGLNMGGIRDRILGGHAAPSIASIAVLPLQNFSGDPEQEYFVDGMTEALIADLAKIGSLKVISRTSVMQYKGTDKRLREIAAELGVDAVIEGSAHRVGDDIRITAQLIDAATEQHLWVETYDRAFTDVLRLQSEVARAIAGEIRVTVAAQEQAQLTVGRRVDPAVYELVLRGQYYANRGTEEDLTKAIEYFEQAIARDPNDAPAHAGLAFSYQHLASGYRPPREVMPKAKAAAQRALELDETIAAAHVTLARVLLFYDWDWPAAEEHLKRATELSPNLAAAHIVYSNYYTALGRPREALAEIRFARALDPLSLVVQSELVFSLMGARQFDEVIAQAHKTIEREPNFAFGYAAAALAYVEKGEFGRALEEMERANKIESNTTMTALAAHVEAAAGNWREAEKLLEDLKAVSRSRYVCAYELAHAYVKLGDSKQAYEWLEKGKQERADCMVWLLSEPWMDPLRGDRQYLELLDYIGLATGKAGPKP